MNDTTEIKVEQAEVATGGKTPKPKRHILLRLFGIKFFGWIKLILLCVLVGFFVMVSEFDPTSPSVNMMGMVEKFMSSALAALRWVGVNFWKPALAGAGIVMPLWLLWRLASLPFRK